MLRESEARDRAAFIELFASADATQSVRVTSARMPVRPNSATCSCRRHGDTNSMRLAVKLGFTEVERFEEYGAEQWFGVWSSATPAG